MDCAELICWSCLILELILTFSRIFHVPEDAVLHAVELSETHREIGLKKQKRIQTSKIKLFSPKTPS